MRIFSVATVLFAMVCVFASCQRSDLSSESPPAVTATFESPLASPTQSETSYELPTVTPTMFSELEGLSSTKALRSALEAHMRFQGHTAYGGPFELWIPVGEWYLFERYRDSEDYLISNSIPGCELQLREGARQIDCLDVSYVALAGREWSICTLAQMPDWLIYSTLYDGGGVFFRVILPAEAPAQERDECQRRAETVLDTFRVLPNEAD